MCSLNMGCASRRSESSVWRTHLFFSNLIDICLYGRLVLYRKCIVIVIVIVKYRYIVIVIVILYSNASNSDFQ